MILCNVPTCEGAAQLWSGKCYIHSLPRKTPTPPHERAKYPDNRCRFCGLQWEITDGVGCFPTREWIRTITTLLEEKLEGYLRVEASIKADARESQVGNET